jgi:hypothetical protein
MRPRPDPKSGRFRLLTLLDEHTRQCLAAHAAWSIRAIDAITVIEAAIDIRAKTKQTLLTMAVALLAAAITGGLRPDFRTQGLE